MTITTRVRIFDPVPPARAHAAATAIVGGNDETAQEVDTTWTPAGSEKIRNLPSQGLGALVWTTYGHDGPMPVYDDDTGPTCCLEVAFDTPLSAPVHFRYVREFGEWLDEQGVKWTWLDEYHGTWHLTIPPADVLGD